MAVPTYEEAYLARLKKRLAEYEAKSRGYAMTCSTPSKYRGYNKLQRSCKMIKEDIALVEVQIAYSKLYKGVLTY